MSELKKIASRIRDEFNALRGLFGQPNGLATLDGSGQLPGSQVSLGGKDTDDLPEGSSNLYFTEPRAQAAMAADLALKQDLSDKGQADGYAALDSSGLLPDSQLSLAGKNSDDLAEGATNLYYSDARAQAALAAALALKENISEKGMANGYASLGADGKVPASQLPALQSAASAQWTEVYVDAAAGNDLTGDGTQLNPYQTIQAAINPLVTSKDWAGLRLRLYLAHGAYNWYRGSLNPGSTDASNEIHNAIVDIVPLDAYTNTNIIATSIDYGLSQITASATWPAAYVKNNTHLRFNQRLGFDPDQAGYQIGLFRVQGAPAGTQVSFQNSGTTGLYDQSNTRSQSGMRCQPLNHWISFNNGGGTFRFVNCTITMRDIVAEARLLLEQCVLDLNRCALYGFPNNSQTRLRVIKRSNFFATDCNFFGLYGDLSIEEGTYTYLLNCNIRETELYMSAGAYLFGTGLHSYIKDANSMNLTLRYGSRAYLGSFFPKHGANVGAGIDTQTGSDLVLSESLGLYPTLDTPTYTPTPTISATLGAKITVQS